MNFASSISSGMGTFTSMARYGELFLCRAEPLLMAVHMIATQTLHLVQSSYFLGVGGLEAALALLAGRKVTLTDSPEKVATVAEAFFAWCSELPSKIVSYSFIHGSLMIGTGVSELLFGLEKFELITLAAATPFVAAFGNSCFLLANIATLIDSAARISRVSDLPLHASEKEVEVAERIKISSILSIISSINYIIGTAIMLVGVPAAGVVLFICLGLLFGGIRILYDWFLPASEEHLSTAQIVDV